MTRPEDFTVYQATDPGTAPEVLEQMAGARPDLRQFVAANPSTAPEVLTWLGDLGDTAVTAALARRSGSGAAWTTPGQEAPSQHGQAQQLPPPGLPAAGYDPYAATSANPYAPPAQGAPYGSPAPGQPAQYGQPAPYAAPAPYGQAGPPVPPDAYGTPQSAPYAAPQSASFGTPTTPFGPPDGFAAAGYGYQPQPTGSRKGLVAAIVVGSVVLIAALIFAATQILGSLGASDFGDDADLDQLWNECAAGDPDACDDLYMNSPIGSDYEEFADTCGNRQPVGTQQWCRDVM